MKLIFDSQGLKQAFSLAAQVAPTKSPRDILQNVKLTAYDSYVTFTATDTEVSVVVRMDSGVEIPHPGRVLLPVVKTGAILRETTEESVAIENHDFKTQIIASRSKFQLLSQCPDEFPDPSAAVGDRYHEIQASTLADLIHKTVFCADEESSRYALGGVQIETDGNLVYAVGTDGKRAGVAYAEGVQFGDHQIDSGKAIVPSRAARLIEKACLAKPKETARVCINLNDIVVELPGCVISARLVEGRFPQWRQVFPKRDVPSKASPINGQFLAAVRQAAIATSQESQGIDFTFSDGSIRMSAQSVDVGESSVEIVSAVEMVGDSESVTSKMDNRFVREFCSVINPEEPIDIEFENANAPVLFVHGTYKYVIMPMAKERQ